MKVFDVGLATQILLYMISRIFQVTTNPDMIKIQDFPKSLSRLEIYYSRLSPVISRLVIVNTMLPTR